MNGFRLFGSQQSLDFYPELMQQMIKIGGKETAQVLAKGLIYVNSDVINLQQRFDLYRKIILVGGGEAAQKIAEDIPDLESSDPKQRLDLYLEIIEAGGQVAATSMSEYFQALNLDSFSPEQRFDLYRKLILVGGNVLGGKNAAIELSKKDCLLKLNIDKASLDQKLEIFNLLLEQSEQQSPLLEHLHTFGLESASFDQLSLLIKNICKEPSNFKGLVDFLNKFKVSKTTLRQLFLIALSSAHKEAKLPFPPFPPFANDILPLVDLLNFRLSVDDPSATEQLDAHIDKLNLFLDKNPRLNFLKTFLKKEKTTLYLNYQIAQCIAFAAGFLYELDEKSLGVIKTLDLLTTIVDYRHPINRYKLISQLADVKQLEQRPASKASSSKESRSWSDLSWILLQKLMVLGLNEKDAHSLYTLIKARNGFKDGKNTTALLDFVLEVIEMQPFTSDEMSLISRCLIDVLSNPPHAKSKHVKGTKQIISDLQALTTIKQIFGWEQLFSCLEKKFHNEKETVNNDYTSFLLENFKNLFDVGEIENFTKKYYNTFARFRDPKAIYTYLGKVNTLSLGDRNRVMQTLNQYVSSVLEGNFSEKRVEIADHPHLETIFSSYPEIKESWIHAEPSQPVFLESSNSQPKTDVFRRFFYNKFVNNKNLDPNQYSILRNFLITGQQQIGALDSLISTGTPEEVNRARYQQLVIHFLEGKKTLEEFLKEMDELSLNLDAHDNDVVFLEQQANQIAERLSYEIGETDDPCDLLLIGTEIQGSCQSVNDPIHYSKCLAGYLINGEIRPIVIRKKTDGSLVARSILRLMWDTTNQRPVLFQEGLYSNRKQDEFLGDAINRWATKKAEQMNIHLVSVGSTSGENQIEQYRGSVDFLGGRAPYIYSDAGNGVQSGPFNIEKAYVLYKPSNLREE